MSWRRRLRRYFFTGLVVLAPLGVTVVILRWLFNTLDAILGNPLERILGVTIPGLGLLLLVATVVLLGWVAHYAIGKEIISLWNRFLARFPLTAKIYNAASQIAQTFMGGQRTAFLRTVLVRFPTESSWSLGWVTAEDNPAAAAVLGEPCLNVFVATTPNPTTGFFIIVPKREARSINVPVEDAMKLILSGGAVLPRGVEPEGLDLATLLRRSQG